ncbi:winged helix-turn-helix domain-containing protein [Paracoccus sp. MC1862]|uniref:winged helix-turn-helix domain-containing protein n=2 Tax=unclassified Paracoccus (in: a-proteobacteria) TaxID=2688777 RepID=UPI001602CB93|nr:LysR family transcriptional regulator [Paracoccus sp. MC1862]MBB1499014.1 LysR family transcriptional regulator [Paracoccus sp. MC1862]QQO44650.1 LysR family transcriptional regulator [Paracoccus sp. MC1862]
MSAPRLHPEFFIRLFLGENAMLGPGKAALLEGIARTGSISAAGRELGMSYKRAWMLVEALNGMFREPLVESARGGAGGGGASLTDTGRQVLALYRGIEAAAAGASADRLSALRGLLPDSSAQK